MDHDDASLAGYLNRRARGARAPAGRGKSPTRSAESAPLVRRAARRRGADGARGGLLRGRPDLRPPALRLALRGKVNFKALHKANSRMQTRRSVIRVELLRVKDKGFLS